MLIQVLQEKKIKYFRWTLGVFFKYYTEKTNMINILV